MTEPSPVHSAVQTQVHSAVQSPGHELNPQASNVSQVKHVVYLGLSLTSIMAAALFVMVFINPKDAAYSYLPLFYAGGSMLSGLLFNRLAAAHS